MIIVFLPASTWAGRAKGQLLMPILQRRCWSQGIFFSTGFKKLSTQSRGQDQEGFAKIDAIIAELGDWRGETLAHLRAMVRRAVPGVIETVKWQKPSNPSGVPVWEHNGIICTGESYKDKVKLTFAKGAKVPDPTGIFNASLEGNARRAIDIREGEKINDQAFMALVAAAAAVK